MEKGETLEQKKLRMEAEIEAFQKQKEELDAEIAEQKRQKAEQEATELADKIKAAETEEAYFLEQAQEMSMKKKKLLEKVPEGTVGDLATTVMYSLVEKVKAIREDLEANASTVENTRVDEELPLLEPNRPRPIADSPKPFGDIKADFDEDESEGWFKGLVTAFKKSKHFDLFKTVLISAVLATLAYQLPNIYFGVFGKENINASFAGMVEQTSFAAFRFFIARLVVDTSFYFNETKFYTYLKRNGNMAFDYQETLMDLTKWQQTLITTIKYCSYLFLFAWLLQV